MTNLIEKSLLIGFGIFTLTIFSSILVPYLGKIAEFNQNEKNLLESYMIFIDEIDQGITYVARNPNQKYLKNIEYPHNLNITIYDQLIKYEFLFEKKICFKIIEYNVTFINNAFHGIPPQTYLLNVSHYLSLIGIYFINLQ
ncbi:MAG: hypothetical protein ACFFDN_50405 [Candidatus Hodarchaeota archaeon]